MQSVVIELAINRQQLLRYYSGQAINIQTKSTDGRQIRLPARYLRPCVSASGLYGRFKLQIDEQHKLVGLQQI